MTYVLVGISCWTLGVWTANAASLLGRRYFRDR